MPIYEMAVDAVGGFSRRGRRDIYELLGDPESRMRYEEYETVAAIVGGCRGAPEVHHAGEQAVGTALSLTGRND